MEESFIMFKHNYRSFLSQDIYLGLYYVEIVQAYSIHSLFGWAVNDFNKCRKGDRRKNALFIKQYHNLFTVEGKCGIFNQCKRLEKR